MMQIPLFKNSFNEKHLESVSKVIRRQKYWANGPEILEFEKMISDYTNNSYCLVFNSGTSAGHALMDLYGVRGKEVIVPSFTFIATANAVLMAGGKPVFADIEDQFFGLDLEDVRRKITDKTVAIMPVHYGGTICEIDGLNSLCEDFNVKLIEDAAESLGARFNDKPAGSFGQAAWFSFTPTKVISTGEGGAIVTNDYNIYERAKLFRSHGRVETADYFDSSDKMDYVSLGYNFRMPSICAALGIQQFRIIEDLIEKRQFISKQLDDAFSQIPNITIPFRSKSRKQIYQMYSIRVKGGRSVRDQLQNFLLKKGITTKVYFDPVHKSKFYRKLGYKDILPVTEKVSGEIISLPIFPDLTMSQIKYIIEAVSNFFEGVNE